MVLRTRRSPTAARVAFVTLAALAACRGGDARDPGTARTEVVGTYRVPVPAELAGAAESPVAVAVITGRERLRVAYALPDTLPGHAARSRGRGAATRSLRGHETEARCRLGDDLRRRLRAHALGPPGSAPRDRTRGPPTTSARRGAVARRFAVDPLVLSFRAPAGRSRRRSLTTRAPARRRRLPVSSVVFPSASTSGSGGVRGRRGAGRPIVPSMHALRLPRLLPGALGLSAALACYGAGDAPGGRRDRVGGRRARAPAPARRVASCSDVDAVLEQQRCRRVPRRRRPTSPRSSHDEFMAPAPSQPEKRLAERVLDARRRPKGACLHRRGRR